MQEQESLSYQMGPIRPPSEAHSLLIRATFNCPWNRCKFCHTYKGGRFELRPVEAIKEDIRTARAIQEKIAEMTEMVHNPPSDAFRNVALWMYSGASSAFLQDANTLIMKTPDLLEVIKCLKETFPTLTRITSYGRSKTAAKKPLAELIELREAGLSRVHMGLESGYDPLLALMDKGVTAAEHIAGGRRVVESGISLCEYVILGLGGRETWREHARETARVLNEIDPAFIRVRTLTISRGMPLFEEKQNGKFVQANDEEIVEEERQLIEHLDCHAEFVSDHITNLLQEVEGKLPGDKGKMLAIINRFQSLPPEERANFILGRRAGIYNRLDDLGDPFRREAVEQLSRRLGNTDEETIRELMEGFI